ncbi:MAG: UDP-N-acetylglucosamine 1-carboxyvinyltransferase [Firmicutes bacterium]|nr:UDP-N-acetylglucosamine 1-carboxyvinyltransferase [Bacillota bacterium]
MEKLVVTGGNKLVGEVTISGAKNAAVAVIPAAILVEGVCRIENIPAIKDVAIIIEMLEQLGAIVQYIDKNTVEIDCTKIHTYTAPYEMVIRMRASYYLVGALLGRFNRAKVAFPGGCDFGVRPIDQHIKGFEALGVKVQMKHGIIHAAADTLKATQVYMDVVSVGATINLILAAVKAKGTTIIENAAKEPHVVDLANFLNAMGANVKGAGTDVIKIRGVERLTGGTYSIIPDQIEAGTFMIAAAAAGGDVLIKNVIPKHLESVTAKLVEMKANVEEYDDAIRVSRTGKLVKANVKTIPYPGFPTDLQPLAAVLLCMAEGTSTITEGVWDSRFQYVDELKRMGAKIKVEGRMAVIEGVERLSGAPVKAVDLRGGAAMVIAGLVGEGITEIRDLSHIDRGYEYFEEKLAGIGADIRRI